MWKHRDLRILWGAIALSVLSKVLGLARESAIVALVGVHDHTDAYFAVSSLVLWFQNWAFGALTLVLVPKYLALPSGERTKWFAALRGRVALCGLGLTLLIALFFQPFEQFMLSGRNVLSLPAAALLLLCVPFTGLGGVTYARALVSPDGILRTAKALFLSNLVGFSSLLTIGFIRTGSDLVLPASLLVTQVSSFLLLNHVSRRAVGENVVPERPGGLDGSTASQVAATTIENVGFNLAAVASQAVGGRLGMGAITVNAFVARLVMQPVTGLLGPLQQGLLVKFSTQSHSQSLSTINRTVGTSLAIGATAGAGLTSALFLGQHLLSETWQGYLNSYNLLWLVFFYGLYAGVVFSNQSLARYMFSAGQGWRYALAMLAAYALGIVSKFMLAPYLGLISLPLCAVVAECGATTFLLLAANRPVRLSLQGL